MFSSPIIAYLSLYYIFKKSIKVDKSACKDIYSCQYKRNILPVDSITKLFPLRFSYWKQIKLIVNIYLVLFTLRGLG